MTVSPTAQAAARVDDPAVRPPAEVHHHRRVPQPGVVQKNTKLGTPPSGAPPSKLLFCAAAGVSGRRQTFTKQVFQDIVLPMTVLEDSIDLSEQVARPHTPSLVGIAGP